MFDTCRANGCKTPCPPRHMMCTSHWAMVPKKMRDKLWEAYRNAPGGDASLYLPYVEACAKAVEHVAKLEKKETANSFRRLMETLKKA